MNLGLAAPVSGIIPAFLLGADMAWQTERATFASEWNCMLHLSTKRLRMPSSPTN